MSDLDERLARWKAQTATLQTPPELKARLKKTSGTVAKAGVSAAVKAGVLFVLAVAVAVGLRFWPATSHPEVATPVVASPAPAVVVEPALAPPGVPPEVVASPVPAVAVEPAVAPPGVVSPVPADPPPAQRLP